ncbi:MAG: alkaline phosphatase [Bacteroidales bacterium]|nr:alkaline phosphatase [Bacteroidales bacterium]
MNRRDTLKLLGSLPLMAFGTTRVSASEHEAVKASAQSPKNIVLISADGMGVCQWQAGMIAAKGKMNLSRMQSAGLLTTNPADVFCGDAPSHSTALATGVNSHKGAVSVDMDNKPVKTITELLKEQGLAVGIVSANTLVEGSIVPFIGHAQNRMATEALTASLVDTGVDVFIGAGSDYFTKSPQMGGFGPGAAGAAAGAAQGQRQGGGQGGQGGGQGGPGGAMPMGERSDKRNLIKELESKGYQVLHSIDEIRNVKSGKLAGFTGASMNPNIQQGRGDMFPVSVETALNVLQSASKGFFLMIGDMYVDRASHNSKIDLLCDEAMDLDRAIGKALDFAERDGQTLVLVVGSPEASGMSLVGGNMAEGTVEAKWSMPGMANHSGTQVPMFAYGPGADQFMGVLENTEVFGKMKRIFGV